MSHKPVAAPAPSLPSPNRPRALRSFALAGVSGLCAMVLLYPASDLFGFFSGIFGRAGVLLAGFLLLNACALFLARGVSFLGTGKPAWLDRVGLPRLGNRFEVMVFSSEEAAREAGLVFHAPIGRLGEQTIFASVTRGGVEYGFEGLRGRHGSQTENSDGTSGRLPDPDPRLYIGNLAYVPLTEDGVSHPPLRV